MLNQIDDYTFEKKLGKGSYGDVYLTSKANSTTMYATKIIDKGLALSPEMKNYFFNEIQILKATHHENIIKLFELKETQERYYMIMEYCNGGTLDDNFRKYFLKNFKPFPENYVQYILRQIACGLYYLHKCNIIHRDLKLENILLQYDSNEDMENLNILKAKIKIIDFGFAKYMSDKCARSICGSPINMDPIILKALAYRRSGEPNYNLKADIWSLGVIVFYILIGQTPFLADNYKELFNKIDEGNYKIPKFLKLSKEAISLVNSLLQFDANERLGIDQLIYHEFLTKNVSDFEYIDLDLVDSGNTFDLVLNSKEDINKIWNKYKTADNNVNLAQLRGSITRKSFITNLEKYEVKGLNNNLLNNYHNNLINLNYNYDYTSSDNTNINNGETYNHLASPEIKNFINANQANTNLKTLNNENDRKNDTKDIITNLKAIPINDINNNFINCNHTSNTNNIAPFPVPNLDGDSSNKGYEYLLAKKCVSFQDNTIMNSNEYKVSVNNLGLPKHNLNSNLIFDQENKKDKDLEAYKKSISSKDVLKVKNKDLYIKDLNLNYNNFNNKNAYAYDDYAIRRLKIESPIEKNFGDYTFKNANLNLDYKKNDITLDIADLKNKINNILNKNVKPTKENEKYEDLERKYSNLKFDTTTTQRNHNINIPNINSFYNIISNNNDFSNLRNENKQQTIFTNVNFNTNNYEPRSKYVNITTVTNYNNDNMKNNYIYKNEIALFNDKIDKIVNQVLNKDNVSYDTYPSNATTNNNIAIKPSENVINRANINSNNYIKNDNKIILNYYPSDVDDINKRLVNINIQPMTFIPDYYGYDHKKDDYSLPDFKKY